jgi:hypothetical protein
VAKDQAVNSTDEEEFYDDAAAAFPSVEQLAPSVPPNYGDGRLVAIWARETGVGKGNSGKPYGYVETVTLVLDDGPSGDQISELIGAAPVRLDLRHSTSGLESRLKGRVTGVNVKGVKLRNRPMIGRINTQPSKQNKNVPAYSIAPPTEDDRKLLESFKPMIIKINQELEAADATDEDSKAFE